MLDLDKLKLIRVKEKLWTDYEIRLILRNNYMVSDTERNSTLEVLSDVEVDAKVKNKLVEDMRKVIYGDIIDRLNIIANNLFINTPSVSGMEYIHESIYDLSELIQQLENKKD